MDFLNSILNTAISLVQAGVNLVKLAFDTVKNALPKPLTKFIGFLYNVTCLAVGIAIWQSAGWIAVGIFGVILLCIDSVLSDSKILEFLLRSSIGEKISFAISLTLGTAINVLLGAVTLIAAVVMDMFGLNKVVVSKATV